MSSSRQRARDLLQAYELSLEQQILGRGSSHACGDQELWRQVEARLTEADAQDAHCLGLDPLEVMEESLKAPPAAARGSKVRSRGRLQDLGKAFEVLEQAALNLYLGPWRHEYKVVKMYSGTFTHFIKPVLSTPQIEKLFGLLGYRPSSQEQLFLQELRTSSASLDDLLRLACAFYLARCECRLLQAALGKHVGESQWELGVVRERQRGNSLQVAMDTTKKTMKVNQPRMEPFAGGVDVDLYTDQLLNGGAAAAGVSDDKPWSSSPPAVKTHGDGFTPQSSSSGAVCITTLNCQLSKMSLGDSGAGSSGGKKPGRRPSEGSRSDKVDPEPQVGGSQVEAAAPGERESEAEHFCSCLQAPHVLLQRCVDCQTLHSITCALLQHCLMERHAVGPFEDLAESGAASPQSLVASDMKASPAPPARSSSDPRDEPESHIPSLQPISFHDCCDLAQLDPQALCHSCSVFHSGSCRDLDYCTVHHATTPLGRCGCGKPCPRKPLVLCRYCGKEYCRDCWYRNPVECTCGRTFDQSSSV
ncbi:spermatogenesis associated 2-like [Limanda limanda]|uniref:spermatogenesis associated 2-like n=1 Tax=Limanda limanda TaxID=27771 RepID=UPI0029C6412C|nr:spermatogenesis associated 2-like [Limanda limanda]XP_060933311.1 spermatogenesis associated 2-like [Limanda limanda]